VLWTRVEAALDAAGVSPPVVATLATTVGVDPVRLDALLSAAERIGLVHRVASNRVFSARQFEALLGLFTDMAAGNGQPVGTGEFRDRSGLGRNLAIAVLEHFDTRRLTRRIGAGRVLVRASE
jgi:selenocysteine-specific elongation factor